MDIERIWDTENQLSTLTGLTKNEADEILPLFEMELQTLGHLKPNAEGRRSKFNTNNVEHAREKIFEWIEVFYNRERMHSSLGYVSPTCFHEKSVAEAS